MFTKGQLEFEMVAKVSNVAHGLIAGISFAVF